MKTKYVIQDEIEAHKAAMQQVVEDEKKEQEAINGKKKRAIEAAQKAFDEDMKSAEERGDQELKKLKRRNKKKLAAMQRAFKRLPLLRQVYHEAPDDVLELIVSKCFKLDEDDIGRGGLNAFRLANKRLQQVAESCTTKLTNWQKEDGPDSLPIHVIKRCGRLEEINCDNNNLRSLEGCPDGLKRLVVGNTSHLSDLSPLASCIKLEVLYIDRKHEDSSITEISAVSSIPLLEEFCIRKSSIKDLSPLSSCPILKRLWIGDNAVVKDLSPLSHLTALASLEIIDCPLITKLEPLSNLRNLNELYCYGIHPDTSLLPLASCTGLKELECDRDAVDLEELMRRRPDLEITLHEEDDEAELVDDEDDWE